ncbi:hypothetical protein GCM10009706_21860 [Curtobacterium citreum]|uniref:DUF3060 family protein n=1 Tax=Curtobacterium citreum TaxID=2036 RepID=A0ABT2HIQ1_9MICO|nr:hypothetical protein [Curtobacterium citreum]MCS6523153.1 hypothetical protein [Curtobacterium citreum]TQJ26824.1 hypothetical protein FB462_0668 [Curtobacterium citreum]GGL82894.1 hypothetical protein GCM10009706_21860 [Curtobacterium citreum]
MIRTRSIITTIAAIALLGTLTGCSGADHTDGSSPTPTKSEAPAALSEGSTPPKTGVCDNGQLTVIAEDLTDNALTLDDPCDTVALLTNGAQVTIDFDVDMLIIEGADNTIRAKTVGKSLATNSGNTVEFRGSAPEKVNGSDTTTYTAR